MRWLCILWVLGSLLATTPAVGGVAPNRSDGLRAEVCVPPGVPPLSAWQFQIAQPTLLRDVTGRPWLGVILVFGAQGQLMASTWVEGQLVAVDPTPDDPQGLIWIDRGVAVAKDRLLDVRSGSCLWALSR